MKKIIFITILIVFTTTVGHCQKSGKIDYSYIANGIEMESSLLFNENISLFNTKMYRSNKTVDVTTKENKEDESKSEMNISMNPYNSIPDDLGLLTNLETNSIIENIYYPQNVSGSLYDTIFEKDLARIIKWEILEETKQINSFVCHKALGNFRGRTYTVWFTLDIPVSFGPWKLNGLPGLILEAYDKKNEYMFYVKKIELNNETVKINYQDFLNKKYVTPKENMEIFMKSMNKIDEEIMQKIRSKSPRGSFSNSSKKEEYIINPETLLEFNFDDIKEE